MDGHKEEEGLVAGGEESQAHQRDTRHRIARRKCPSESHPVGQKPSQDLGGPIEDEEDTADGPDLDPAQREVIRNH